MAISYCTTHLSKRSIRNAKAKNRGSIIWLVSPAACWQNADMKTIVLEEPGRLLVTETDPPAGISGEDVLVRVRNVGICGTDLHAYRGRQPFFEYPRILGHELGVEVIDPGESSTGLQAGDLCSVEPYLNCGNCIACRDDRPNCCTSLQVLGVHVDGGMREIISVPAGKLHRSELLSTDQLALVETLGIGSHAVERAGIVPGESVLVVGCGPIGLSVIQFAQLAGARLSVLDLDTERLRFCGEHFNVENTILAGEDAAARLAKTLDGRPPTVVFDVTGNASSMMGSFQFVAQGGRIVFVGIVMDDITFHDPDFHRMELTLLASRNSRPRDFKKIIEAMESGAIDTGPWITHRSGCDAFVESFSRWVEPGSGVVKAVLDM